jgi:hypothetical protein
MEHTVMEQHSKQIRTHHILQQRRDPTMTHDALVALLAVVLNCYSTTALQQSTSLLTNTKWKVRLDVGQQPGTWMPKRFPGWAASGARLGLDLEIQFTDIPCGVRETLVGPKDSTFRLQVCSDPSTFVSERGQEQVTFLDGGWCIERPSNNVKNARGNLVRPEGLLKFWLDCPSGAKRRDVEIFPGLRIFFTTGVWDDPTGVKQQDEEYREVLAELNEVVDATRERKKQEGANLMDELVNFQKMVGVSKEFDGLKLRKETLEMGLPPPGASVATNGVQIAPTGSLVIKGNNIPDWLPGSEYLILGTFSTRAADR